MSLVVFPFSLYRDLYMAMASSLRTNFAMIAGGSGWCTNPSLSSHCFPGGSLWLMEISSSWIEMSMISATLQTISFVSSSLSTGMPLISKHSLWEYCSCSSNCASSCLQTLVIVLTWDFKALFSRFRFWFSFSSTATFLMSDSYFASKNCSDRSSGAIFFSMILFISSAVKPIMI